MTETLNCDTDPYADLPQPLILYDGVCGLCNGTVKFVIKRDPAAQFHFAPMQSSLSRKILTQHIDVAGYLSSVVLVENGKTYFRSTAALRIVRNLKSPARLLWCLIVIPRPMRDCVYVFIARHRYGWFGKSDACQTPDPEVAARFLGN
jgi:predicted DCC family thiol-disulfide oxidoreductase YuxK